MNTDEIQSRSMVSSCLDTPKKVYYPHGSLKCTRWEKQWIQSTADKEWYV